MFPTWRLRLREARMAWRSGRYDEASVLLAAESLRDFLPAKKLARNVAEKILERAGERLAHGDSAAGWRDLTTADRLGGETQAIAQMRHRYVDEAINDVQRYLAAGEIALAQAQLEKLHHRGLSDQRVRDCHKIAQLMQEAEDSAARGHFAEASAALKRAAALATAASAGKGTMDDITRRLAGDAQRLAKNGEECQRLSAEMHAALAAENWSAALSAADALLAIAPQHAAAGQARRRAWRSVGMDVTQPHRGRRGGGFVSLQLNHAVARGARHSTKGSRLCEDDTVAGDEHPRRALLWIDAVGGFLVCLDDCVVLGQPPAGERIAVPILADLSRRHAAIRREAGAYILEPLQRTLVDGREIKTPFVLSDNQLIQLGDNVRVRFTRPHALSATAKLTIESHHKTQPSADAVLLMADSCVLGPNRHCHVRCRDWQSDVVVFRQNDRLFCRASEPLTIDGAAMSGESEIQSGVRVEGEAFSFTWETVE
ncbi:MAG TPA: FHA domain-containing protein [Lacipirellulaceae bacterium]